MTELERARRCAEKMCGEDKASRALGIEVDIPRPGAAVARMQVRDNMLNGFGVCHGGLIFTLADTAFAFACNAYDRVTVAASGNIEFLRPAKLGDDLQATAHEDHRGRNSGLYTAEICNQRDELVAVFRGRSVSRDEALLGDT